MYPPAGSIWIFQIIFLGLFIVPAIFFLITLQNTLKVISPENRKIPPSNVWLLSIPFFGFFWQFIIVDKIAQSIAAECVKLNLPVKDNKPTYNIGLVWNICFILSMVPVIKGLLSLVAMIAWIIYWVKVNNYKKLIITNQDNYLVDAEKIFFMEIRLLMKIANLRPNCSSKSGKGNLLLW